MRLKATASFSGLRGNRAHNEIFEVPDDGGQALIDENYPVEVIDGKPQEHAAAGSEEPVADGKEQEGQSDPAADDSQEHAAAGSEEPVADGKEQEDGRDAGGEGEGASDSKPAARGRRSSASKA